MRLIGCEYGQGLYYGEPHEHAKVVQLLKALAKSEKNQDKPHRQLPAAVPPPRPAEGQSDAPPTMPAQPAQSHAPVPKFVSTKSVTSPG